MGTVRGLQKGRRKRALSPPPVSAATSKSRPRVRALSPGEPLPCKAARSQSARSLALPNMRELLTSKRDARPTTLADMPGPKTLPVKSLSDEESSTTSEPLAEKARHKLLARRSRRRLRTYVDQLFESRKGHNPLSLLEQQAVTAKTAEYYEKEYHGFLDYRKARNLTNLLDSNETDAVMTDYFNFLFLKGHPAHRGDKVLASFVHHHPGYSRQGYLRLPAAARALKGWRRLAPGSSRKAYPLAVWAALALQLVAMDQLRMAVFLLVCLSAYTRPSELFRCRVFSLVRPTAQISTEWSLLLSPEEEGVRSKVGEFDDSLVLDSPYLKPWASSLFKTMKQGRPEEPLWDFPYCDFIRCFTKAADRLSLPVTPYQLRHSGPSIDRSRNLRSLVEVQKRGRWKSHKSVARYEKSARLAATFGSLPLKVQQFCLSAEKQLGDVMSGRASCPKFE